MPLLLFSLLTLANWLGWRHENGLIRQMITTQSRNIAQELRWRFKQQLDERLADLADLGGVWRSVSDTQREKRPELYRLDLNPLPGRAQLHQQVQQSGLPLASPPLTLSTGRPGLVIRMKVAPPVKAESLPTGTESILFVDDEAVLTEIAKQLLQSLGYQVTVMSSPVEALERIRSHPNGFDLLITDQTMPKMTGVELARAVRDHQPDLLVVLSSGFGEILQGKSLDQLNIALFLMKPFDISQLARTVRLALDRPRPRPQP